MRELPPGYSEAQPEREVPEGYEIAPAREDVVPIQASFSPLGIGLQGINTLAGSNIKDRITKDLITNDPIDGFADRMVRGVPGMVGGALGMAGGPVGMGVGGAAGESLRQAAVAAYSTTGQTQAPSLLQAAGNPVAEGVLQYAGGKSAPYIAKGVSVGAEKVGQGIKNFAEWSGKNIAGVSKQAYEFARDNVGTVAKYIGADPAKANALAGQLRDSVEQAAKAGEDYYRQVVGKIVGPQSGQTAKINVKAAISDAMAGIKKQFGYDAPIPGTPDSQAATGLLDQFGSPIQKTIPGKAPIDGVKRILSPDEAREFAKFESLVSELSEATPEQVYYLQRDLNNAIMRFDDKPLGVALKQVRSQVRKMVEDNAQALPDLVEANKAYAAAQDLRETSKKLVNANDLVGEIRRTFANEFQTGKKAAIEEIAKRVPGVGQTAEELRGFNAAQQFDPYFRSLPQTGMGALFAGSGAAAVANPATMVGTVPLALLASPRAQFAALQYGPNVSKIAGQASQAALNYIPRMAPAIGGGGSALAEQYLQRRYRVAP